jgi:hypothetical protein
MLLTAEAYDWNPVQSGLLALAEGAGRFTLERKQLVLLDVPAGTRQVLTGPESVAFEPAWSPDGKRLAFTFLAAPDKATGSGAELEQLLAGRAIAVYDLDTGELIIWTAPGDLALDGWPRWTPDGRLLYARKLLETQATEIRLLDLRSGADDLLFSLSNAPEACHRTACGWDQLIAYAGPINAQLPAGQILTPTPIPEVAADTGRPGWQRYSDAAYGIAFSFPDSWRLEQDEKYPNQILLNKGSYTLSIGYRRPAQNVMIQRTGVPAGELQFRPAVQFFGGSLPAARLIFQGKVKAVLYANAVEFPTGSLVFTLSLDDLQTSDFAEVNIPADVQTEADEILTTFESTLP